MGQTVLFAFTFLPSFLIGRISGERLRQHVAGLVPDTFGGMCFFFAIVAFMALTLDGVIGHLVPDYLHQPVWFLFTGFASGQLLAVLRGMFLTVPEKPEPIRRRPTAHQAQYRPSSALPPEDFCLPRR